MLSLQIEIENLAQAHENEELKSEICSLFLIKPEFLSLIEETRSVPVRNFLVKEWKQKSSTTPFMLKPCK